MIEFAGIWSHALAASLFGALSVWAARRALAEDSQAFRPLSLACLLTAAWALATAVAAPPSAPAFLIEHVRNIGWLAVMYALWAPRERRAVQRPVAFLYGIVSTLIALTAATDLLSLVTGTFGRMNDPALLSSLVLRVAIAAGALVLVHNLYTAATADSRATIRLVMVALAAMWLYDLNLYTISYLGRNWSADLIHLRGLVMVAAALLVGLSIRRAAIWRLQLSRSMTFQSLGVVAIGGYVLIMVLATSAIEMVGGPLVRPAQVAFVFAASVAALVLLPSRAFRAWFRVKLSKHLFRHRYDYRSEWLRFTDTIGRRGDDAPPLEQRIVQAVADITEAPGGMLLVPDEAGAMTLLARWNWPGADAPATAASTEVASFFSRTGRIVELDAVRGEDAGEEDEAAIIPEWMLSDTQAWALVPLVHFDRLAGLVLLARPPVSRTLDWEDFDLLRTVGRQVASYLAEAQGQQALADVHRFDEFNRRFAFIMHDVKNLVSQLALVTRNAERHADNPEFRADMIATLRNSTARMNDLLARLSQHNTGRAGEAQPVSALALVEAVARQKRPVHPVVIGGSADLTMLADPARLEQALVHLVQNAIEASPRVEPVLIELGTNGREAIIAVIDRGAGMSAAFIRESLFRPFASTKDGGFGIGAYEARSLVMAMGGRLEVSSREGRGSRFAVILPLAPAEQPERKAEAA
jgi:putative PEP-CTERM system histidine kinase